MTKRIIINKEVDGIDTKLIWLYNDIITEAEKIEMLAEAAREILNTVNHKRLIHNILYGNDSFMIEAPEPKMQKAEPHPLNQCDICGHEITGEPFTVYDEQYNEQPWLMQCEVCAFQSNPEKCKCTFCEDK